MTLANQVFSAAEVDERQSLTRLELLARGGVAGLALLGSSTGTRLLGGVVDDALAARPALAPTTVRRFVSRPDLRPMALTIRHPAKGAGKGLLFIAPSSGPGQRGPLIFDNHGEPVWSLRTPVTATAFRASTLHGKPVLTWWEGTYSREGLGRGVYVIVDDSYRLIARIKAGGYMDGDLHEFLITPEGTALVTKNPFVTQDTRAYGGTSGTKVYGGIVQEIEIPSGRVLFEWNSLDHVGLDESYARPDPNNHFDYFHINSVDVAPDGHLLVSARNTWAMYKVHRKTGEVLWRLGGKKSNFAMGTGTVTAWQHDARFHGSGSLISIFDNGAAPQAHTQSRVVLLRLDTTRMRATLERAYTHRPGRLVAKYMGNGQLLPDGGVVSGWGSEPFVTEFGPKGDIRFEAVMPKGGQTYRAFRFPWTGRPAAAPRLAAGIAGGKRGLFASWNGATEVAAWQVRYGPSTGNLQSGPVVPRSGFETYIGRPAGARVVDVIALDKHQKPLRRSTPLRL